VAGLKPGTYADTGTGRWSEPAPRSTRASARTPADVGAGVQPWGSLT